MGVPPIKPSIIVSLIGGAGVPDPEEKAVHNPTLAHFAIECFFIGALMLALWALGHSLAEADHDEGY